MTTPFGVNVLDYGADPTGATGSTAAFRNAIAANAGPVFVPPGLYAVDPIVLPSGAHIVGCGPTSIIQTEPANQGGVFWQTASGATGVEIEHLAFNWPGAFMPGSECLAFINASYCSAHDLHVSGAYMGIVVTAGSHIAISNNHIENTGWFGICVAGSGYVQITGNHVNDTVHEGINLTNTSYSIVAGNFVVWNAVQSLDMGISLSGQPAVGGETSICCNMNLVQGNQIQNCGGAGVGLASTPPGTVIFASVKDNIVTLPNRRHLDLQHGGGGGVLMWGSMTQLNSIEGNTVYDDGATAHAVYSWTQNGAPSSNNIGSNYAVGISGSNVG